LVPHGLRVERSEAQGAIPDSKVLLTPPRNHSLTLWFKYFFPEHEKEEVKNDGNLL